MLLKNIKDEVKIKIAKELIILKIIKLFKVVNFKKEFQIGA